MLDTVTDQNMEMAGENNYFTPSPQSFSNDGKAILVWMIFL